MFYFKPKRIPISVGTRFVVMLTKESAHLLDLRAGDHITIKNGNIKLNAILDIVLDHEIKKGEIGLYVDTWEKLKVTRGDRRVSISLADRPKSLVYIREKLDGKVLTAEELDQIIKDVVNDNLSEVEMTYFVSACYTKGLNDEETVALTKAIVNNGGKLTFKDKIVIDKHCIGGVPGNRSTMLAVPILTSLGLRMPKTSSRAITSPSGTADTMEVLANVTNNAAKLTKIANKVGGFISWGGGVDIAGADDKLIKVRNPMSLDPQGMLLASILAKKHAVSATHVLIDIPYGPDVKVKTAAAAAPLQTKFEKIGAMLGMKVKVVLTDGSQPIGNGVGPILEAIDVMKVLKNDPTAPEDLVKKTIWVCGVMLEMIGKATLGEGKKIAQEAIVSGKAYKKMIEIIQAQGPTRIKLRPGKFTYELKAYKNGQIVAINNKVISRYARLAGAPLDPGAGIFVDKKIGTKVKKGDVLATVYAQNQSRLTNTIESLKVEDAYKIE